MKRSRFSEEQIIAILKEHEAGVAPDKIGGHKLRLLADALHDWLLERAQRDFTLRGLAAELGAEFGVKVTFRSGASFTKKVSRPDLRAPVL